MDLDSFQNLPSHEVARLVREAGSTVCAFPINGTRRWFMLEHAPEPGRSLESIYGDYRAITARRYVEVFRLFFDHGVDTLLSPSFGPDLMARGEAYTRMAIAGLAQLAADPIFTDFYAAYQVRVRFYGDYRDVFANGPHAHLLELFEDLTRRTQGNNRHRLFYGLFANDATEAVARLATNYFQKHGRAPDRKAIVEQYYGEYVAPVNFFIGFDKFSAYDMPLLALGDEDLYFTVTPSLYMDERQLREILYDHLFTRRAEEGDEWPTMRRFYQANRGKTIGVGAQRDGFWYPLSQVNLPPDFMNEDTDGS